jgi:outer membrane murein-binding lipoprotein Lpp
MDISPYVGSIVTVVIAIVGGYVAMKNANNQRFLELTTQIATLTAKVDDLKDQVEKHNTVIERTYKLETDMGTAYKRIDELKARDEKIEEKMERLHG